MVLPSVANSGLWYILFRNPRASARRNQSNLEKHSEILRCYRSFFLYSFSKLGSVLINGISSGLSG